MLPATKDHFSVLLCSTKSQIANIIGLYSNHYCKLLFCDLVSAFSQLQLFATWGFPVANN